MTNTNYVTRSGMEIDTNYLNNNGEQMMFQPFYVKKTQSLTDAIGLGRVKADEDLVLNQLENGTVIALVKKQLAYHHVAQGEHDGEAWMVWF